jgi:IS4 transposase
MSRLKKSANPVITEELREWRARAIPLEGNQIHDVVDDLSRKYIDVEVEAEFKRGQYEGTRSLDTKRSASSASSSPTPTTTISTSRTCREMSSSRKT